MLNGISYLRGGCCTTSFVAKVLLIVGGINWGLIGLGTLINRDLDLIYMILGSMPTLEAIVYILVGVAAVMKIFGCRCKKCMAVCGSCGCTAPDKDSSAM